LATDECVLQVYLSNDSEFTLNNIAQFINLEEIQPRKTKNWECKSTTPRKVMSANPVRAGKHGTF